MGAIPTLIWVGGIEYQIAASVVDPQLVIGNIGINRTKDIVGGGRRGEDIGKENGMPEDGDDTGGGIGAVDVVADERNAHLFVFWVGFAENDGAGFVQKGAIYNPLAIADKCALVNSAEIKLIQAKCFGIELEGYLNSTERVETPILHSGAIRLVGILEGEMINGVIMGIEVH